MSGIKLQSEIDEIFNKEHEAYQPNLEVVEGEQPAHPQWVKFRPLFVEAMKGGLHDISHVEKLMGQNRAVFFPGKNAAVIAEKSEYSGCSVFQATWAVGDLQEIILLAPGIEAMGRLLGCSEMLVEGRFGWGKVLKPMGYEPWSMTMRKAL